MSNPAELQVEMESGGHHVLHIQCGHRSLADQLAAHGLPLNTRCGGRGLCRGCEVFLLKGTLNEDRTRIAAPATVRACRAGLSGPVSVRIPARSLIEHRTQVGETFEISVPSGHRPLFRPLPGGRDTAFAVDLGTTTLVLLLMDLETGEVLATVGGLNRQVRFGDNVLTRIEAAHGAGNLSAMQQAVVAETLQPLLLQACERTGRPPDRIAGGAVAGNTTMLHLLVGEDPRPLGIAPFTPQFIEGRQVSASDIGLLCDGLPADTPVQLLPGISAYVGADITAGAYATGMLFDGEPALLVDMGTNGEILLHANGTLTACATAAGPAFEGSGLCCGTRARHGAVSKLLVNLNPFDLRIETVGHIALSRTEGICGSAYVDFLASGRASGLLEATGRFDLAVWNRVPAANRFLENGERALKLTGADRVNPLRISESDVALLLQAKAAIGAGIEILLRESGVRLSDLGKVYVAGGFGMGLNIANAIAMGLLPGITEAQVRVVGNTSLAGALLVLEDRTILEELETLRTRVKVLELNLAEDFEDCYVEHLLLP